MKAITPSSRIGLVGLTAAALMVGLASCGSSSSASHTSVVMTTQSYSSVFGHARLSTGTYSVQLSKCATPAEGFLVLAEATAQGGYDPGSGSTLKDGGTVTVSKSDSYGIVPFNADLTAMSAATDKLCYPWSVTFTSGATAEPTSPPQHTLQGTFTLYDISIGLTSCIGQSGYSDIGPGTQAVVKNASGTILGTGTFDSGTASADNSSCVYKFSVPNLPDSSFYTVTVSHRGDQTYSLSDLTVSGWTVGLTLGQ
jgi:hypothetical protein